MRVFSYLTVASLVLRPPPFQGPGYQAVLQAQIIIVSSFILLDLEAPSAESQAK